MDGLKLRFDTGTADSNPAVGYLKLDSVDQSAAGHIYASKTDRFGSDAAALLLTLDDSSSDLRAVLWLCDRDDPSKTLVLHVTGAVVDAIGYVKIPVGVVGELGGADPLEQDAELSLSWAFTGDVGSAEGPQGEPGSTWLQGAAVPSDVDGADGDFYLRTSNGDVYQKGSGTWGDPVANLTGPAGEQGEQGDPGDPGDQGEQGDTGPAAGALVYVFSSTTTISDPGIGRLRLSNADQEAADRLVIDDVDDAGTDAQKWLRVWNEIDGQPVRGIAWVQRRTSPTSGHVLRVLNVVEQAGYFEVEIENLLELGPDNPLQDGDEVLVSFGFGGAPTTLTPDRAVQTAANGALEASNVTRAELAFLAAALTRTLSYTDSGAALGPVLRLLRESASPAASDLLGAIELAGRSSTAVERVFARLIASIVSPTNAAETGQLSLQVLLAGTLREVLRLASTGANLYLADDGAAAGPLFKLMRESASPAASDAIGEIDLSGRNSSAAEIVYARVLATILDPVAATEDSQLDFFVRLAGALVNTLRVTGTGIEVLQSDDGATAGPLLALKRTSASPAAADNLGAIEAYGRNASAAEIRFARIAASILTATAGAEDGILTLGVRSGGASTDVAQVRPTGVRLLLGTASRTYGTDANKDLVPIGGIREVLTAARSYFVRSDGSNSNSGLANTAGGAFLTLQKAIDTVAALDLSTFGVTITIGLAGSYAGFNAGSAWVGGPGSFVALVGDPANAGNFVITSTVLVQNNCVMRISGVDFTPASGDGLVVASRASVTLNGACNFGAASGARQILIVSGGTVTATAVLTMDGSAGNWILATGAGCEFSSNSLAHVFSGTPTYSTTVAVQNTAVVSIVNATPTGAAVGTRYSVSLNGVLFVNGGGANFIPGNVAGSTATGGQYA